MFVNYSNPNQHRAKTSSRLHKQYGSCGYGVQQQANQHNRIVAGNVLQHGVPQGQQQYQVGSYYKGFQVKQPAVQYITQPIAQLNLFGKNIESSQSERKKKPTTALPMTPTRDIRVRLNENEK